MDYGNFGIGMIVVGGIGLAMWIFRAAKGNAPSTPKCKGNPNYWEHDVPSWTDTSGNGKYGYCNDCGDKITEEERR